MNWRKLRLKISINKIIKGIDVLNHTLFAILIALTLCSHTYAKQKHPFVEWENPSPRFSETGFDFEAIADTVGGGLVVIVQQPIDIELWTEGEVIPYQQARF